MKSNTTWTAIGQDVKGATMEEVLKGAKLDYTVAKEKVFMQNGIAIPNKYCTKIEGTNDVFGIVGPDYNIIQNADAFGFVDNIVPYGLEYMKAGQTYWGLVYVIAKLPEYKIFGDAVETFIIFQNSHDGGTTLKATVCPLRIICQNQFALAFKKSKNTISIRHTRSAEAKLEEAKHVMQETLGYTEQFKALAKGLAQMKINSVREEKVLEAIFPVSEKDSEKKVERMQEARAAVHGIYTNTENLQNFRGTGWGLLNAYSDYETHREPARKSEGWTDTTFYKSLDTGKMDKFVDVLRKSA